MGCISNSADMPDLEIWNVKLSWARSKAAFIVSHVSIWNTMFKISQHIQMPMEDIKERF